MLEIPLLADYGQYHRDARNRICHEIGIPLIVLAIIIALRYGHAGPIDFAEIAIAALGAYYLWLARAGAALAIVALIALYLLAGFFTWPFALGFFVVGWILQFVGHAYEGKAPAFLTNVVHLLVGPLWIAALAQSRLRVRSSS